MLFSLDGRLSVCADLVRQGAKIADVGTDHAYLPVWLAKNGRIKSAVACDIREKPLRSGAENIERYGCGDIVTARLSDGLDEVSADEADDIIIAGMGAELICDIIERAPWLRSEDKNLILQPMTKAHILREYLCKNGFAIISETPCSHAGKNYSVILAKFTGNVCDVNDSYYYFGELAPDDAARGYIVGVVDKLLKKRRGILCTGGDSEKLDRVLNDIKLKFGVDENDVSQSDI